MEDPPATNEEMLVQFQHHDNTLEDESMMCQSCEKLFPKVEALIGHMDEKHENIRSMEGVDPNAICPKLYEGEFSEIIHF